MSSAEAAFIARLRPLAAPGARGLLDDAAVLALPPGRELVLTKDLLVEGVHFLPGDPPGDVAWKLLATNLSDLAAKGAMPIGVLLGYPLGNEDWDAAFADGFAAALQAFAVPLLGGDTVAGPRVLSLTALGSVAAGGAPARSEAQAGDTIWVSGTIGDAGIGLARARAGASADDPFVRRYRRPEPRLALGQALARHVHAMMDVSDGLLIDLSRMAAASGVAARLDLDAVPVSLGGDRAGRVAAAQAGDDYELLFAAAPGDSPWLESLSKSLGLKLTLIGRFEGGSGLFVADRGGAVPLPRRLGYEHGQAEAGGDDAGGRDP